MIRHLPSTLPLLLGLAYAAIVFIVARDPAGDWTRLTLGKIGDYWPPIVMIAPLMLLGAAYRERARGGTRSLTDLVRTFLADRRAALLVPIASAVIAGAAYNVFKQRVLPRSGYGYDAALAQLDRAILGGNAWTISHALMPGAWATHVLDLLYHPLFFPMTLGVALCTYLPQRSAARFRYLVGLTLLLAVPATIGSWLLPAVGPCFDAALHAATRFQPLSALLQAQEAAIGQPIAALDYQAQLLRLFGTTTIADGAGISALPSIHNGLSTLFICFALSLHRRLAWILIPYAALILLGSVHLGWHYAVDGVAGIVGAIAIWFATAPLARAIGLGVDGEPDARAPQIVPVPPLAPNTLPLVKLTDGSANVT